MIRIFNNFYRMFLKVQFWIMQAPKRIETGEVLTALHLSHAALSVSAVSAENDKLIAKSTISAVNVRHGVFVLDSIPIEYEFKLIKKGSWLRITAENQDRSMQFNARYIEPFLNQKQLGYLFEFPECIIKKRNRDNLRYEPDGVKAVKLILNAEAGQSIQSINGAVKNISTRGLGLSVSDLSVDSLQILKSLGRSKVDCEIELNDTSVQCQVEINHLHAAQSSSTVYLGGLLSMQTDVANEVDGYIDNLDLVKKKTWLLG